jgi:hypothetical protein
MGANGGQESDEKTGRGHETSFSLNRQAQSLRPAHCPHFQQAGILDLL